MNLKDITLLTVSFNNNLLTGMMLKSFYKQVGELPEVVIIDNGDKIPVDESLKSCFTVIDNFNHKLLENEFQASRNHCSAIDYALKNCIKTEWCLLVDNDILFKPAIKNFLNELNENDFDACGEIGWDKTPPNRLFPYFCLINVKRFKKENLNYFDRNNITCFCTEGKKETEQSKYNIKDTGYSFYESIKHLWRIQKIKLGELIVHLKGAMLYKKNVKAWLDKNRDLI